MTLWLKRKSQDSRVYMCLKELRWDLEQSSGLRRAKVAAMAALLPTTMLTKLGHLDSTFDRPLDFPRDTLMDLYKILEDLRNTGKLQLKRTQRNMSQFGLELPEFAADHAIVSNRALEVWMATIGAGILPNRRDDAREVWSLLHGSRAFLDDAIASIQATEKQTEEMSGQPSAGFSTVYTNSEWKELCEFVPSQLRRPS